MTPSLIVLLECSQSIFDHMCCDNVLDISKAYKSRVLFGLLKQFKDYMFARKSKHQGWHIILLTCLFSHHCQILLEAY